jgi:hypothetical protein
MKLTPRRVRWRARLARTTHYHAALKDVHTQQPAELWESKSAIKADDQLNLTLGMAELFETP